jgi:hypothetical protein
MITAIFLLLGIVACSSTSSLKVGWVEQSGFNHTTASYTTFSGVERRRLNADAGETISLDYDVTVDDGALTLRIRDEQDTAVWEQTFTSDHAGLVDIPLENEGTYEIAIIGEKTGGGFDLNWQIQ